MGDKIDHTLENHNQLRHYGVKVQDNPVSNKSLHIMTENQEFNMELKIKEITIFADTFTPSDKELSSCPHIIMSSPHEWNPHDVQFHSQARQFEDKMTQRYKISAFQQAEFNSFESVKKFIFNIGDFNNRVIVSHQRRVKP